MTDILRLSEDISQNTLRRTVEILSSGGVIIVPTDTVYGLITKAFSKQAFKHLERIKGNRLFPYVVLFESIQNLKEHFISLNPFQVRVIESLAFTPATFILNPGENTPSNYRYSEFGIGVRIAQNELITKISKQLDSPLWATSANRGGGFAPVSFKEIDDSLIEEVDLAFNGNVTKYAEASTVVDLRKMPFQILRAGPQMDRISAVLKQSRTPLEVLVVCTGNICRSPLTEALLTDGFGDPKYAGVRISSAGTHASPGFPATDYMLNISREWGIDYSDHEARFLTEELVYNSDIILVNETAHADWIIDRYPAIADRIQYLGEPLGLRNIPDPYGYDQDFYQKSADLIREVSKEWAIRIRSIIDEIGWTPLL